MKKGKILIVVGLITLLMTGGLVLAGCKSGCPNSGCTVSTDGSGSTCTEGDCAAYKYMSSNNRSGLPPSCDC